MVHSFDGGGTPNIAHYYPWRRLDELVTHALGEACCEHWATSHGWHPGSSRGADTIYHAGDETVITPEELADATDCGEGHPAVLEEWIRKSKVAVHG